MSAIGFVRGFVVSYRARQLGERKMLAPKMEQVARLLQGYEDRGQMGFVPICPLPPELLTKMPAGLAYFPVLGPDDAIHLRAAILVAEGAPSAVVRHEMAHLETGMPQRLPLRDSFKMLGGDIDLYGISPFATERIEMATNEVAILDLLASQDEAAAGLLVAAQETYSVRAGMVRAVLSAETVLRAVSDVREHGVRQGVRHAVRRAMARGVEEGQRAALSMCDRMGVSRAAYKRGRETIREVFARGSSEEVLAPWLLSPLVPAKVRTVTLKDAPPELREKLKAAQDSLARRREQEAPQEAGFDDKEFL